MSNFTWHLMDEEAPEQRENDYLVMGLRGGLYLANGFEHLNDKPERSYFYIVNHKHHWLWSEKVLAWAEIPPLEVGE